VGFVPDDLVPLVELESGLAEIVDWQRTAPLLQHVQLLDVQIGDQPKLMKGVSDRDFELAGYEILALSRTGPLIVERSSDGRVDIQFLFHPDRSSLVFRVGFPILVQNAVQLAMTRAALTEARGLRSGILPARRLKPETEYTITGPHGFSEASKSDKDGYLLGLGVPFVGIYEIEGDGEPQRLGVSLLASSESTLNSVGTLKFPETSVEAATSTVKSDQPLWGWFALAGLFLMTVEWWYFQKKPSGIPA
jgi:hypothetical protein